MGVPPVAAGLILAVLAGFSVSGGLKRISSISEKLIPVLSAVFILACFIIIGKNAENLLPCLKYIVKEAFTVKAVSGYGMAKAARYGISRGVFSNEAGLGSSTILHSETDNSDGEVQGMWAMTEVFIDTIFMCSLTAIVILIRSLGSKMNKAQFA